MQVVEEADMWKQRQKELGSKESRGSSYSFLKDRGVDMHYEFLDRRDRRAHMDDEPKSTYWMNELYKAEAADKDRCGYCIKGNILACENREKFGPFLA